MNKRRLHHTMVQMRKLRVWYLVVVVAVCGLITIIALRQNSSRALQLLETVHKVDQQNGDVEAALRDLRTHVYNHMNSSLVVSGGAYPPIQLKYRYERLVAAEKSRVEAANGSLYTTAQRQCEAQIPAGRSLGRIQCIQDYIVSNGGVAERAVPDSLYKFDFVPPRWSPDLAGFMVVITAFLGFALVVRTALGAWFKYQI